MGEIVIPTPDLKFLIDANEIAELAKERAISIARNQGTPRNLHGLCARASAIVFKGLTLRGHAATIAYSYSETRFMGHVFIISDDTDYLIDVTASQFSSKYSIVIRPWNKKLPWYWSKIMREMNTLKELRSWTSDWGDEQRVRKKDYEIFS